MRRKRNKWICILVIVGFLVVIGWPTNECWAAGPKYPNKPIQIVIGFAPGSTDMALRSFTDSFVDYLGQPAVFVYKPGALGAIGISFVAQSKPDGYTILGSPHVSLIVTTLTQKDVGYKLDDFAPICRVSTSPQLLVVRADSPFKTFSDILEEAKRSPAKLTCSTSGVFSGPHLALERLTQLAGINITHVPCSGSNPAVTALLGGHVNMVIAPMASISPHLKPGTLRPIAFFEKERLKEFPDVATFSEFGYPLVHYISYGLYAPKGTREEVIKTIYKATEKIIGDHKKIIEDSLRKMSLKLDFLDPEETANKLKEEADIFRKIIKELEKSGK